MGSAHDANPRGRSAEALVAEWMSQEHRILPDNALITYLAEGAANIVYKVSVPGESSWNRQLLRLRKDVKGADPVLQSHANFVSYIQPLLSKGDILNQQLVSLTSSNIIPNLNRQLRDWEEGIWHPDNNESRSPRRQGVYLANDNFGLLIDDMSPGPDEALIQFKPKWLLQSPDAPPSSKRCRVCALRARREAQILMKKPVISSMPDFCPLTLVSKSPEALDYATESLLKLHVFDHIHPGREKQIRRLRHWIKTTNIFKDLQALQRSCDPHGVLKTSNDQDDVNLRIAMTLRDVSVYILLPHDLDQPIRAGIADLDLKSSSKLESWKRAERELIDEGWYEGHEADKQTSSECWVNRANT